MDQSSGQNLAGNLETGAADALNLLALVAQRISHDIRSPLGVSKSVVDDFREGLKLTAEDFEDAAGGLTTILEMANLFGDLLPCAGGVVESASVAGLLEQAWPRPEIELDLALVNSSYICLAQRELLVAGFRQILLYFAENDLSQMQLRATATGSEVQVRLRFPWSGGALNFPARSLLELSLSDRRVFALRLLYGSLAIAVNRGRTMFAVENGMATVDLLLQRV